MTITATFDSIEEMEAFAKKLAGAKHTVQPSTDPRKVSTCVEVQAEEEPQEAAAETRQETVAEEQQEAVAQDQETARDEEPKYTLEQVRAKLAELQKAGKRAEVKALLNSFGVSKLSEIPAEQYGALMVKAGEI